MAVHFHLEFRGAERDLAIGWHRIQKSVNHMLAWLVVSISLRVEDKIVSVIPLAPAADKSSLEYEYHVIVFLKYRLQLPDMGEDQLFGCVPWFVRSFAAVRIAEADDCFRPVFPERSKIGTDAVKIVFSDFASDIIRKMELQQEQCMAQFPSGIDRRGAYRRLGCLMYFYRCVKASFGVGNIHVSGRVAHFFHAREFRFGAAILATCHGRHDCGSQEQ